MSYAAEFLLDQPAFWLHYLSGPLGAYPESQSAFDVPAADLDAMWNVLNDPQRWPVISLRFGADEEHRLRIVYRNLEDEAGLDFVEERPGRPAEVIASVEGHGFTSAISWAELLAAAALPDEPLTWAQRLLLMLPILGRQEMPGDAQQVLERALAGIDAGHRPALAAILVAGKDWRAR